MGLLDLSMNDSPVKIHDAIKRGRLQKKSKHGLWQERYFSLVGPEVLPLASEWPSEKIFSKAKLFNN